MGRMFAGKKCTHCEYHPGELADGVGFSLVFVGPATCRTCASIISVFRDATTIRESEWHEGYEAHLRSVTGPDSLFNKEIEFNTCQHCGGHDLIHHSRAELWLLRQREGKVSQDENFHLPCPRCATGKIVFVGAGLWD